MKNKQITFGAFISYLAIAFNILSGFLYTPWMIRTIGDEQYALYTLALSVINVFLLDFGIGSAVTKFLSNYFARGQYDEANRFLGIVYKVFIAISFAIAVVLTVFYFFIDTVYSKLTPDEISVFKTLFIIVSVYSVLSFPFTTFNGVLMSNERFIEVKLCNLGQKVFSVALIVYLLLTGGSVYSLVAVHAVSNLIFITVKYFLIRAKTTQRAVMSAWDKPIAKSLFGYSAWYTLMNLAHRCVFNIMPTLIAATIGSLPVTLFAIAATLEGYVYTFADAVNGMFMPRVSKILTLESPREKLTSLMIKIGRFHVFTIGLMFIGFVCIGREFMLLWMGDGYDMVYVCAAILILPSLVSVPQQVARTALLALDIVKEQSIIYTAMAVINIILSLALLPVFGVVGAAVAVCVSYFIRTVGMNVLYNKKLPIDLKMYFKSTYLRWSAVAAITLAVGIPLGIFAPDLGWIGLLLKSLAVAVIYSVLFFVIALDSDTKRRLFSKLKK